MDSTPNHHAAAGSTTAPAVARCRNGGSVQPPVLPPPRHHQPLRSAGVSLSELRASSEEPAHRTEATATKKPKQGDHQEQVVDGEQQGCKEEEKKEKEKVVVEADVDDDDLIQPWVCVQISNVQHRQLSVAVGGGDVEEFFLDWHRIIAAIAKEIGTIVRMDMANSIQVGQHVGFGTCLIPRSALGLLEELNDRLQNHPGSPRLMLPEDSPLVYPRRLKLEVRRQNPIVLNKKAGGGKLLNQIHERVATIVKARGISLPAFFDHYDQDRCGYVTGTQFSERIVTVHRFPTLTFAEINSLLRHYSRSKLDSATPTTLLFNYRPFLAAICPMGPTRHAAVAEQTFWWRHTPNPCEATTCMVKCVCCPQTWVEVSAKLDA